MYDSKIGKKTNNNNNVLEEEREKVQALIAELEKTKNDAQTLL
jgi:hypothetical protein